jgi:hypothetical protein
MFVPREAAWSFVKWSISIYQLFRAGVWACRMDDIRRFFFVQKVASLYLLYPGDVYSDIVFIQHYFVCTKCSN